MRICLEEPNCTALLTWGYTDKHSFYKEPKNALPFDKNFKPKMGFYQMIGQLKWYRKHVVGNLASIPTEPMALGYDEAAEEQEGFVQI